MLVSVGPNSTGSLETMCLKFDAPVIPAIDDGNVVTNSVNNHSTIIHVLFVLDLFSIL